MTCKCYGMTEAKITNSMREALVSISQDKEPSSGFETLMRCVEAGLLNYDDRRYSLTPEGSKVASEFKKAMELQRAKRNRSSKARHATLTSLGMKRTRSGAYEGVSMKNIKEGLSDGPDDSAQIIAAVNKHLSIGDRQIYYKPMLPGLWINYYNLPKGSGKAGGGAEAENNRVALLIRPKGDKYSVEYKISAIGREWGLRAKTAPLDKLGQYIANHLNKIAKEVPPKWTHARQEAVMNIEDRMHKLLGEEDDSDEMLDELLSEMDEEDIDFLHSLDEDELTDFFEEYLAEGGGCKEDELMVFGKCVPDPCPSGKIRRGGRCVSKEDADEYDKEEKRKYASSAQQLARIDAKDKYAKELAAKVAAQRAAR